MTTSTFSLAISPPLFRWNMGHVRNAQRLVTFHRPVYDVDGVRAQHGINGCAWPSGPAFDLVLPHAIDKLALVLGRQLREISPEQPATALVDGDDGGSIEVGEGRTD